MKKQQKKLLASLSIALVIALTGCNSSVISSISEGGFYSSDPLVGSSSYGTSSEAGQSSYGPSSNPNKDVTPVYQGMTITRASEYRANPNTLKRDIDFMDKYELKNISCCDMFPRTKHCESVTVLERR